MTLTTSEPSWFSLGVWGVIVLVWIGPIGLFVLRKHLAKAKGARLVAKAILTLLTVLTAPAAAVMTLMVLIGTGEAVAFFWFLLRDAW